MINKCLGCIYKVEEECVLAYKLINEVRFCPLDTGKQKHELLVKIEKEISKAEVEVEALKRVYSLVEEWINKGGK